ncbi:tyrosine-protein kinase family protein [Limnothrix sp. FACHB-1083]|uniref:ParA family protein n=1 Tax=unclassified Limnothrix TaxID=2632864 RepID=UPI0016804050|nr:MULTISPECIES: AAA family ATPase [unclassified Limnothrix]MBD2161619.1 tyrosine-protein kinase family protein [Limnothrix sp. FACHB-1083]MBD2192332.1 tyrosine-protein kinase family protein [Limnothrix sp. FACHB-1088]
MLSLKSLIRKLQDVYGADSLKVVYRHPTLYLACISEEFATVPPDQRDVIAANKIQSSTATIYETLYYASASIDFLAPNEFENGYSSQLRERGYHYASALTQDFLHQPALDTVEEADDRLKVVHFYGYKGGQARSTILVMLSKALANDGWKVLVVDLDTEAPSLDVLYGAPNESIRSTLLGFGRSGVDVEPSQVFSSIGQVDAIFCRPAISEYEIEAAVLPLRLSMDSLLTERLAREVEKVAKKHSYDIVLCDHRSGISATPLPWISTLKGPTVICNRLDYQWQLAKEFFQALLRENSTDRGCFISFKPDNETRDSYERRTAAQREELLELLADVENSNLSSEESDNLAIGLLEDHWIMWPYDSAFRESHSGQMPEISELADQTKDSINNIRSVLSLGLLDKKVIQDQIQESSDEGLLVQTKNFRELLRPGNETAYIFGKKGTGKTRLVTEIAKKGLGQPLLVDAEDSTLQGIQASSLIIQEARAIESYKDNPINFWYDLLIAGLETVIEDRKTSRAKLELKFKQRVDNSKSLPKRSSTLDELVKQIKELDLTRESRTFLIDSVEIAFNAKLIRRYTEALFEFMRSVTSEVRWSEVIKIKLFIRDDLRRYSAENLEQQARTSKQLRLEWGTQEIFNFLLSRISKKPWYQDHFPNTVKKLEMQRNELERADVSEQECEELILEIFPPKLKRSGIKMLTFLKTYFADTASGYASQLSYYPRVYEIFLDIIADPSSNKDWRSFEFQNKQLDGGKINSLLVFTAHEDAAVQYMTQVRDELFNVLDLDSDSEKNKEHVERLLKAFEGRESPFVFAVRVQEIADSTQFPESKVRDVLQQMKDWGIFEDRVRYTGEWRVGGLFKSGLKMVYRRKTNTGD